MYFLLQIVMKLQIVAPMVSAIPKDNAIAISDIDPLDARFVMWTGMVPTARNVRIHCHTFVVYCLFVDCNPVTTCSNHGACDEVNGECLCAYRFLPPYCNQCENNYYGTYCDICKWENGRRRNQTFLISICRLWSQCYMQWRWSMQY